jgi:hypothetical protein
LNLEHAAGYSLPTRTRTRIDREEVIPLPRFRYLAFLIIALGLVSAPLLQGKGSPTDILIQSTTDVYGELSPCG